MSNHCRKGGLFHKWQCNIDNYLGGKVRSILHNKHQTEFQIGERSKDKKWCHTSTRRKHEWITNGILIVWESGKLF